MRDRKDITSQYKRLPRLRRLEYLYAYLEDVKAKRTTRQIIRHLNEILEHFEVQKAQALGHQRKQPPNAENLLAECERMAMQLQFAERNNNGNVRLLPKGEELLANRETPGGCQTLIERLWLIYFHFGRLLVFLDQQPDKTVVLPVRRAKGFFSKVALQRYGLEIDHFSFEMVRDIATELGLVNWRIVEERERWQHVYLVVDMVLSRRAKKGGHIRVQSDEGVYTITFIKPKPKDFLAALAEAYLELTDDRPKYPVLYPEIRGKVCERLRISDEVFDANVFSLMKKRQKVKLGDAVFRMIIYPSSGVLNYAKLPPNMLKHLPPKQSGKFISFLKIDIHRERGAGGY